VLPLHYQHDAVLEHFQAQQVHADSLVRCRNLTADMAAAAVEQRCKLIWCHHADMPHCKKRIVMHHIVSSVSVCAGGACKDNDQSNQAHGALTPSKEPSARLVKQLKLKGSSNSLRKSIDSQLWLQERNRSVQDVHVHLIMSYPVMAVTAKHWRNARSLIQFASLSDYDAAGTLQRTATYLVRCNTVLPMNGCR
jgi:hypothetical protein